MIELIVNGKRRTTAGALTVAEFLAQLEIDPLIVAVEHNGEIIRREQFADRRLASGDVLEIVRMVGGGCL